MKRKRTITAVTAIHWFVRVLLVKLELCSRKTADSVYISAREAKWEKLYPDKDYYTLE